MIKKKKKRFKSKKKKKLIVISIILGILLACWLIFKILMVNAYHSIDSVDKFFDSFNTRIYYSVNSNYSGDDLFEYTDNIKFKNYIDDSFKKSEISTLKSDGKAFSYSASSKKTAINVGEEYSYVEMFKEELDYFTDDHMLEMFNINTKKREKLLKENNIKNDIDFFTYVKYVNNTDISIFTPIYKIEELASVKLFSSVVLPEIDSFWVLEGDLEGYTLVNKDFKEIVILKDNKKYFIGIFGKQFNSTVFEELLSSLEITD